MSNYARCGCEDGYDCTKTTVCHVQTVVEDYEYEIERLQGIFDKEEAAHTKTMRESAQEIERLREALARIANHPGGHPDSGEPLRDIAREALL